LEILGKAYVKHQQTEIARHWWLTPIIPATQETEIRRIEVGSQLRQIVHDPILKNPSQKRAGGVTQGEGPEFKSQYLTHTHTHTHTHTKINK
jgi:hypothetical protein